MKLEFREFGDNKWYDYRERGEYWEIFKLMHHSAIQAVCINDRVELWIGRFGLPGYVVYVDGHGTQCDKWADAVRFVINNL